MSDTTAETEDCQDCAQISSRVIAASVGFALFAAYVAADFASGGRVTGWVLALIGGARSAGAREDTP